MTRIYLDYNASTPIDPAVVAVMQPLLQEAFGNPSSGHWASQNAKAFLERAREQVAALLGAHADEIVFTSGGSEANNLALKGTHFALREQGNHIISQVTEHPAVLKPLAFLEQLGATVTLLNERDLATADLSAYDAIMTGTRAYAVREDLKTYNKRLLDYVKAGGNMIVLYNTFEMVPNEFAPFPGELLASAEEVSEEDSPVTILAPTEQSFNWPNKITVKDFDDWVEQRGSKFWTTWDKAYTPMISTFDKGQPPQSGGWLTATYGKGHWTYFAYALHRQLPYGVPGAFRITANLLALGKTPK